MEIDWGSLACLSKSRKSSASQVNGRAINVGRAKPHQAQRGAVIEIYEGRTSANILRIAELSNCQLFLTFCELFTILCVFHNHVSTKILVLEFYILFRLIIKSIFLSVNEMKYNCDVKYELSTFNKCNASNTSAHVAVTV